MRKIKLRKNGSAEEIKVLDALLSPGVTLTAAKLIVFFRLKEIRSGNMWTQPLKIEDICKEVDKCNAGVSQAIRELKKKGWLETRKGKGQIKEYKLNYVVPETKVNTPRRKIKLSRTQ